jgi:putative phosphoribosyl transferase
MVFADRDEAGRRLAARLGHLRGESAVVLGLPRGGVPVAFQVAQALGAPLDVIVVRKLGVPQQPELAMGAVADGGVQVVNRQVVRMAGVPEKVLAAVAERERAAVEARAARYRARWPRQPLHGRTAVVVGGGIATGATARAACQVARAYGAARVVLAVPVAPRGCRPYSQRRRPGHPAVRPAHPRRGGQPETHPGLPAPARPCTFPRSFCVTKPACGCRRCQGR